MNHPLVIRKNPNGTITVKNSVEEKTVDVSKVVPSEKVDLVRQALLDIGEVWNEHTENRVLSALFS